MCQLSQTHERLLSLKSFFEHFISKESPSDFTAKLENYVVDSDLPNLQNFEQLDIWQNKLFETKRYPVLSSIERAFLSIFIRLMVENLFSMINDIIDSRYGRIEINTYSAIMIVKYQLKSAGVIASSKFYRKDILRDPIDRNLCYMRTSCSWYKKRLSTKRESMLKGQRKLRANENPKIKGAKNRSKVHEKVTLKSAFHLVIIFFADQND